MTEATLTLAEEYLRGIRLADSVWGERIVEAALRGRFTNDDIQEAGGWVTCACGKVGAPIKRIEERDLETPTEQHLIGSPVDKELAELGSEFYECVKQDDFLGAATSLGRIELRASKLAEAVGKTNNMQVVEWLHTPASRGDMKVNRRYLVLVGYDHCQEWELVWYRELGSDFVEDGNHCPLYKVQDLLEIGLLPEAK